MPMRSKKMLQGRHRAAKSIDQSCPEKHLQTSGGCKLCLRESRICMQDRELLRDPAVRPENLSDDLPQKQAKERV